MPRLPLIFAFALLFIATGVFVGIAVSRCDGGKSAVVAAPFDVASSSSEFSDKRIANFERLAKKAGGTVKDGRYVPPPFDTSRWVSSASGGPARAKHKYKHVPGACDIITFIPVTWVPAGPDEIATMPTCPRDSSDRPLVLRDCGAVDTIVDGHHIFKCTKYIPPENPNFKRYFGKFGR